MIFDYTNIPDKTKPYRILDYKTIEGKATEDVDLESKTLFEDMNKLGWRMAKTCVDHDGIGLAGPQIGVFKNVFIVIGFLKPHTWQFDGHFHMMINPTFKAPKRVEMTGFPEGCLSVPDKTITLQRPNVIDVEYWYFNEKKKLNKNIEPLQGLPARVFQHEYDHLIGTNIVAVHHNQTTPRRRGRGKAKPKAE